MEDCILSSVEDSAKLIIIYAKLHVLIVTLSAKDNVNLTKQLSNGFKRSIYWNIYQTILVKVTNKETNIYELLSASFQGVKRLFVLAYVIHCTKNHISLSKYSEKMIFPKKIALECDLSSIIRKDDISFPRKYDIIP